MGLQERYMSMVEKDGLFQKDQTEHESPVVNCDICQYQCKAKYLVTHQILHHYHTEYSKELLNFHNRKEVGRKGLTGSCPVYQCKCEVNCKDNAKLALLSIHYEKKH